MDHQFRRWMFLTNHARVLRIIARDPDARLGTIAAACQITERTVQAIIADLEQADYLHGNGTDGAASTSSTLTSRSGTPPKPARARALVELAIDGATQPPKTPSASVTVS
ncbi:AsnC family transcriptional regulator [Streptomyces mirabilis]|uniref:AsnC family transcriptional regulator n=1 Tax=Streptomyces mirabilis TaxID=68239 RepID=UPI0036DC4BEE